MATNFATRLSPLESAGPPRVERMIEIIERAEKRLVRLCATMDRQPVGSENYRWAVSLANENRDLIDECRAELRTLIGGVDPYRLADAIGAGQ